jgi:hypothetical protein
VLDQWHRSGGSTFPSSSRRSKTSGSSKSIVVAFAQPDEPRVVHSAVGSEGYRVGKLVIGYLSYNITTSLTYAYYDVGMLRVSAILLALMVGLDHFVFDGRYIAAAGKVLYLLLHRV